jgi:hypothetical protein
MLDSPRTQRSSRGRAADDEAFSAPATVSDLHTETNDTDLTYFFGYHLGVLRTALNNLSRKVSEVKQPTSRTEPELDSGSLMMP